MQEFEKNPELISALADGQLRAAAFAQTLAWLGKDEEARMTWQAYHLVGDVLRMGTTTRSALEANLLPVLKPRLQSEEVPLSCRDTIEIVATDAYSTMARGKNEEERWSANEAFFKSSWSLGVASLAVTLLVAWELLSGLGALREVPKLAQAPNPSVSLTPVLAQRAGAGETQPMVRDPQLDALLAAHRQFGGTSALQGPSGFLRNATFEGVAR